MELSQAYENIRLLKESIHREFVGKENAIDLILVCLLAGGHVLLEDVPGVGKTMLAKVISKAAGLSLGRIQFTPDTLPSDVVGLSVYNMKTGDFTWKSGAVMHQLVLADEINRTPPKTQSSLLEVMAEGQVSVDGVTHVMEDPFMVIATENPMEYVGTYPLPEAQLDRFMMRLSLGYPEQENELAIARDELLRSSKQEMAVQKTVTAVLTGNELCEMKELAMSVTVSEQILSYMEAIVKRTREEDKLRLGASTRALLALSRAARAYAFLKQRNYVLPDDIKVLVKPVFAHRFLLSAEAKRQHVTAEDILTDLLTRVRVPV